MLQKAACFTSYGFCKNFSKKESYIVKKGNILLYLTPTYCLFSWNQGRFQSGRLKEVTTLTFSDDESRII